MDLAAGPDRHWYEHRDERNADRTSTGSTPGTSHRRLGAGGRLYAELLQWRPELVRGGSGWYLALDLGAAVGGGIIECQTRRPLWLPYAEVKRIGDSTERARRLGAAVLLEPREGPSGWRSVVSSPVAGEVALWEPKR
jgi:predicted enzyme related to lactoylglutathione lyase